MPAKCGAHLTHTAARNKLPTLQTRACCDGEWFGRFQVLDHGAEINRFRINCLVFGNLRPVQYFEAVPLEHFLPAPTFESNDLTVDPLFAGAVEVTQIRAHK